MEAILTNWLTILEALFLEALDSGARFGGPSAQIFLCALHDLGVEWPNH
jgi:hypothetical protein